MNESIRVGADVSGTFTDVALQVVGSQGNVDLSITKVLTGYSHPEVAVVEGIVQAAEQAGIALKDI